jgi:hypothetical protein
VGNCVFDVEDFIPLNDVTENSLVRWFAREKVFINTKLPKFTYKIISVDIHPNYDVYMFADTDDNYCILAGRYLAVQIHKNEKNILLEEYSKF